MFIMIKRHAENHRSSILWLMYVSPEGITCSISTILFFPEQSEKKRCQGDLHNEKTKSSQSNNGRTKCAGDLKKSQDSLRNCENEVSQLIQLA